MLKDSVRNYEPANALWLDKANSLYEKIFRDSSRSKEVHYIWPLRSLRISPEDLEELMKRYLKDYEVRVRERLEWADAFLVRLLQVKEKNLGKINRKDVKIAAKLLRNGEILVFPTETVYGIGVVYDSKAAFDHLVAAKKRPPSKPFALMCSSLEQAFPVCGSRAEGQSGHGTILAGRADGFGSREERFA
jgi:hypothetical protein